MHLRDTLRKAAGLLVEMPPEDPAAQAAGGIQGLDTTSAADAAQAEVDAILSRGKPPGPPAAKTVEQILHESEGPNLEEIKANTTASPAPLPTGEEVDLPSIYQQAGLPPAAFGAEQMLDMLGALPPELPLETRRQTVKVTLTALGKSMGATPDSIAADASRKLAALTAYQEHVSEQTATFVAQAQQEIGRLQAEVEEKRKEIETAGLRLRQVSTRCEAESQRLDDVLEFFSLDVPPSKHAPTVNPTNGGNHPVRANQ